MEKLSITNINSVAPYQVEEGDCPNAFHFITDYGVDIAVAFDEDFIMKTGESYEFSISNANQRPSPRDLKVKDSVLAIIAEFFAKNKAALLYICETTDMRQAARNRLFASWFSDAHVQDIYTLLSAIVKDEYGIENYAAVIIRRDNPLYVEYVTEFGKLVNLFTFKPHHE